MSVALKFDISAGGVAPKRATETSSGYDLYTPEAFTLPAGGEHVIDLKVSWDPSDLIYTDTLNVITFNGDNRRTVKMVPCGIVRPRSGLGFKYNIEPFHGLIDCDYRGSFNVKLFNWGTEDKSFNVGDAIAQLHVIYSIANPVTVTTILSKTARGDGGFGSTGA